MTGLAFDIGSAVGFVPCCVALAKMRPSAATLLASVKWLGLIVTVLWIAQAVARHFV